MVIRFRSEARTLEKPATLGLSALVALTVSLALVSSFPTLAQGRAKAEPEKQRELKQRRSMRAQKAVPDDSSLQPYVGTKEVLYQLWHPPTDVSASPVDEGRLEDSALGDSGAVAQEYDDPEYRKLGSRPVAEPDPETSLQPLHPEPSPKYSERWTPAIGGVDPMVAAGKSYIIVSQQQRFGFYDRRGNLLKDGTGSDLIVTSDAFFRKFVLPKRADGSFNEDNINHYLGFPDDSSASCDLHDPSPGGFCIVDFYDTRVLYDPAHDRFIIQAQARHANGLNSKDPKLGHLSRRFLAFAVSRTANPKDGFHQYMLTDSNGRDFPWMTVSGDFLVSAHRGAQTTTGPVATVLHLPSMMAGEKQIPHFSYYPKDIGDAEDATLIAAMHYPGESELTWMTRRGKTDEREIFAFAPPKDPSQAPELLRTSVQVTDGVHPVKENLVYRNGHLISTSVRRTGEDQWDLWMVRIPVRRTRKGIAASNDPAEGFFDGFLHLEQAPRGDLVISRERPAVAVNARGDTMIAYGRYSPSGSPAILPEVRYSIWYAGEPAPRRSRLLMPGQAQPMKNGSPLSIGGGMDYTTAVVDPLDDLSFWIAHEYGASTGRYELVIGKVSP